VALELTLAEERTRRQIAKDLHDQVGQALAFCQIKLGHLREAARSGLHVRSIDDVRESISGVIKHTRQLTFELGSPILYELGLEAALERLVEKMGEQYGIALQFADDGQPKPLDDDTRSAFYIVIKELLTNVVKHAHAQKARVWLRRDGETAVASVTDDGAGMEPSKAGQGFTEGGGYGLFSARERMNYLGGTLEINSQPGGGSTITVTAPLKRKKRRKG
jgi:signal transduction histidine kinase